MTYGRRERAVTATYPDDSIQTLCSSWWDKTSGPPVLEYGRLLWAFLPHVDQQPSGLVAKGRTDPEAHGEADIEIQPLRSNQPPREAYLPVAGLPTYEGEVRIVQRAKRRPALVLSNAGAEIDVGLKTGAARYQTNRAVLVAPYYGADPGGSRGGWRPEFVQRIRRAEYPQYAWDSLPTGGATDSILRFDHIQPLGVSAQAVELMPYRLSSDAAEVIEEWLAWFRTGELSADGMIAYFRAEIGRA